MWVVLIICFLRCTIQLQQNGQWFASNYTNNSFLFNFLQKNRGFAEIRDSQQQIIKVILKCNVSTNKKIEMKIFMEQQNYRDEAFFQLKSKHIRFAFLTEDQSIFTRQQQSAKRIFFNITLVHRQRLQLVSNEGNFIIELVDIQKKYSHIFAKLQAVLILMCCLSLSMIIRLVDINRQNTIKRIQILGDFSIQLLTILLFRAALGISMQRHFLSAKISERIQIYLACGIFYTYFSYVILLNRYRVPGLNFINFTPFLKTTKIVFWFSQIIFVFGLIQKLRLWHILVFTNLYESYVLLSVKTKLNKKKLKQSILHLLLYAFPIGIFPLFYQEINYPKEQAELWWVYVILYAFQVAIFYLKSNGGLALNLRRIKYLLRKWRKCRKEGSYSELQNLCPICLQQIQTEISMNSIADGVVAAIEQFVKNSCNHYFHKACIRDNIHAIDECFLDSSPLEKDFQQMGNNHQPSIIM